MKKRLLILFLGILSINLHGQSREQDSLALVALYHATDGDNWINNNGWLQPETTLDQWNGIYISGNRVSQIYLHSNNLNGSIPEELGNLDNLGLLHLYDNNLSGELPAILGNLKMVSSMAISFTQISGEIPSSLADATGLQELYLQNTNLSGAIPHAFTNNTNLSLLNLENTSVCLPDYDEMNNWASTRVQGSPASCPEDLFFGFEIFGFTRETIIDHENGTITVYVEDGETILDLSYLRPFFYVTDGVTVQLDTAGSFVTQTSWTSVVDFTFPREYIIVSSLPTKTYTVTMIKEVANTNSVSPSELAALIDLYNATDGENWSDNTHWLSTEVDVSEWAGITVANGHVTSIQLENNNLQGSIPAAIGELTSLVSLNLASNQLTGNLPEEIFNINTLEVLDISNNPLMSGSLSPMIVNLDQITFFNFAGTDICEFWTQNFQDWRDEPGRTFTSSEVYCNTEAFIETFSVPGELRQSSTIFVSQKIWIALYLPETADITNLIPSFTISEGAEVYRLQNESEITPITSGETIDFTDGITLYVVAEDGVTSRIFDVYVELVPDIVKGVAAQDYFALTAFYSSASESRWEDDTNWENSSAEWSVGANVVDWFGVTVENSRVTELVLPNNNVALLGGVNVDVLTQLTALQRLDLSGNFVNVLPDLTSMENLVELNVADCYLTPAQLLPNLSLFTSPSQYSPQAVYDDPYYFIDVIEGNSLVMDDSWISEFDLVLTGNEEYQWYFGNNPIAGQNASTLEITDFNMSNVGQYSVEITHPDLPGYSWVILLIEATVLPANAEITSFGFAGIDAYATINSERASIEVSVASGMDLTALVPEFTLSDGASAEYVVAGVPTALTSGNATIDFSNDLTVTVSSGDGSITRVWRITVEDNILAGIIEQDYYAILDFWSNTSGLQWANSTNWNVPGAVVADWFGVTVENFRVTELILPNNAVTIEDVGQMQPLKQLTALQKLDLSGNNIYAFSSLTSLPALTELNIANNRLTPFFIIPNIGLFTDPNQYTPQVGVDNELSFTVPEGGTFTFDNLQQEFGLSLIQEDQFQWFLEGVPVAGGNAATLVVEDFDESKEGLYSVEITSPYLPDFTFLQPLGVVSMVAASDENSIIAFELASQLSPAQIDEENSEVILSISCLEDLQLVPVFTLSDGAQAYVADQLQESGVSAVDFTATVTYVVEAENGDTREWTVALVTPDPITEVTATISDNTQCDPSNGSIVVDAIIQGNTTIVDFTNFTFEWSDDNFITIQSNESSIDELSAGIYQLRVTDNTTACEIETSFEVLEDIDLPTIPVEVTDNTVCNGIGNGRLAITSDLMDWDFGWYSGEGQAKSFIGGSTAAVDLSSGTYTLVGFYYPTGCSIEEVYEIQSVDSQIEVQSTVTNNTDCNSPNGSITINAILIDGNELAINESNFGLVWSHSAFGPSLSNLSGGTYTITITDNFTDCVFEESFTIDTQTLSGVLQVATNNANTNCENFNGSASVTVSGETAGYDFEWFNGANAAGNPIATGPAITGRGAGTFTVKATESGTTCESTLSLTINSNPNTIVAVLSASENTNCENPNGSVEVSSIRVNGTDQNSVAGYSIEWSTTTAFTDIISRNRSANGLAAGTYYVRVSEIGTGCTSPVANIRVEDNIVLPEFALSIVDNTLCGTNGNGTASVTEVEEDWIIEWYEGDMENQISNQASSNLTGLVAGSYSVRVIDPATGCETIESFTVSDTPQIINITLSSQANEKCEEVNGVVAIDRITTNGVVADNFNDYSIEWSATSNFSTILSTNAEVTDLASGIYYARVVLKSSGCSSAVANVTVGENLPELPVELISIEENLPGGEPTGVLSISTTESAIIEWYAGEEATGDVIGEVAVLSGLAEGLYTVLITDQESGCFTTATFEVALSPLAIQTISFTLPEFVYQDELPLLLEAVSDQDLPMEYKIVSGVGSIVSDQLVNAASGELIIEAFNEGSDAVAPASASAAIIIRGNYNVSGLITGVENTDQLQGTVRALGDQDEVIDEVDIIAGAYQFTGLRVGDYRFLVRLEGSSQELAWDTYYPEALFFGDAVEVEVTGETVLDLSVVARTSSQQGNGRIKGRISEGNGSSRIVIGRTLEGTPLEGVNIYLIDSNTDLIVNSAKTNASGEFEMTGIASGSYIIKLDVPGFSLDNLEAAFDFDENAGTLEISAEIGSGGLVIEYAVVAGTEDLQNEVLFYPNPVQEVLYIRAGGVPITDIKIYNLSGVLVMNLTPNIAESYQVSGLTGGVYLLMIRTMDGNTQNEKIIIKN